MIIEHNITEDRFERIEYEPMCSDLPHKTFVKKDDEGEVITRNITLTYVSRSDRITIKAFRIYSENKLEYRKSYTFTIVDDGGKSGSFDDEYIHLKIQDGRLLKPRISKPTLKNKGLDKIIKLGYIAAEEKYESWMYNHKEEPEYYPLDENGFPEEQPFCDSLNSDLWQIGFEYMEETPSLRSVLNRCGTDAVGYAYFDGVHKYIDEYFKKSEPDNGLLQPIENEEEIDSILDADDID